ncbi:MAG: N-acetyltransferase, partial [Methylovulum sp.]
MEGNGLVSRAPGDHAGAAGCVVLTALIRPGRLADLNDLVKLENAGFVTDRLSRRSFRHWLTTEHRALLVAELMQRVVGYILIIYHPGTRLARIYSIAVLPEQRGTGVA